ncbi:CbtA family protein [Actinophytocola glycyrrhizae]|uniref:CbtA family protein n=1 Tax=Actinophytocola glycyrrhizae TaxID=2044873 RepID=A0ABV9SBJ4_9PSEU
MRALLVAGLLAGLIGGVLAFGFAAVAGEPPVEVAIAIEEQGTGGHDHGESGGHDHGAEVAEVSRDVQSTFGLAIATCAFGAALGGLFALAFAFANGRIGTPTPRATAWTVTAVGFVAFAFVPYLVYPPNPPAVGQAETIGERTAVYFAMAGLSVVLAVVAVRVSARFSWLGRVGAGIGYVAAVAVVAALLPAFHEVPDDFPAQTLWEFRLASLGTQAVLWSTIGVVFAALLDRVAQRETKRATEAGLAAG